LIRLHRAYDVVDVPSQIKKEAAAGAATMLQAADWPPELLPIDPVYIARRIGVEVINASLDSDTLGALVKRPGERPTILINEKDNENRRRFTCAHELGHFVRRSPSWSSHEVPYLTLEARSHGPSRQR
jgi:Zn-dependent peptidase ImmA (M78 family)